MFDFFSSVVDFFSGGGGVTAALLDSIAALWAAIVGLATQLWNALKTVANFLWSAIQALGRALQWLWDNFFKGIFTRIWNALNRAWDWLEEKLAPVLRVLLKIRAWLDKYIFPWVKKVINIIQHVRQVLLIFRLLHIKFADALDRRLAQVQGVISSVYLTIRGTLNEVIDVLEGISDPRKLIRLVLISVVGRRLAAAAVRVFTGLPIGHFFPNTGPGALPWEKPVTSSAQLADPLTNPPPSALLGGLAALPVNYFLDGSPIPTDAGLDDPGDGYIADVVMNQFLDAESGAGAPGPGGMDIVNLVAHGSGNLAGLLENTQDAADALAPDVALAGA